MYWVGLDESRINIMPCPDIDDILISPSPCVYCQETTELRKNQE